MAKRGLVLGGLILGLGAATYVAYTKLAKKNREVTENEEA